MVDDWLVKTAPAGHTLTVNTFIKITKLSDIFLQTTEHNQLAQSVSVRRSEIGRPQECKSQIDLLRNTIHAL
jgi:hypothetical protein